MKGRTRDGAVTAAGVDRRAAGRSSDACGIRAGLLRRHDLGRTGRRDVQHRRHRLSWSRLLLLRRGGRGGR